MVVAGFEFAQGSLSPHNMMLFLGLALGVAVITLLALGVSLTLDAAGRTARALYYRRRRWGWRLVWLVAVPMLGPLALVTIGLLRVDAGVRHQAGVLAGWLGDRRRAFRPLTRRPV